MEYMRKLQGITLPFLKLRPSHCILFQSSGIPQLINWSIDSKDIRDSLKKAITSHYYLYL